MHKATLALTLILPALLHGGWRDKAGSPVRDPRRTLAAEPKRFSRDAGFLPPRPKSGMRLRANAASAQSANTPPLVKQFEEVSYYLKDVAFVDANTGWAVGETHWDQTTRQYKGTIVKTPDGGTTWTPQDAGVAESLSGVFFLNASQGWVVGANGTILHTGDGGLHWTGQTVAAADDFRGVVFTDANNGWAASVRPVHRNRFGEDDDWQGGVWHTADGGLTWNPQQVPASASLLNRIVFVDSQNGWAAGMKVAGYDPFGATHLGAIYRTEDGGRTWSEQYVTSGGLTFTALHFVDSMNGWAAGFPHSSAYNGGCTFHTSDGGRTWQPQNAGGFYDQVRAIRFLDRNRGYAVGTAYVGDGTAVWRTLDGGVTWTDVSMAHTNPLTTEGLWAVAVTANQVIIVGDRDYLAKSTNPWESPATSCGSLQCLFTQTYINPHYIFHDVFFTDANNGWVVGSKTMTVSLWGHVILHTADGGDTWQTQYQDAPPDTLFSYHRLESVHFADSLNGWAAGTSRHGADLKEHNAILHTTDGGVTWTEQGRELYASWGLEFSAVQFLDKQNGWALVTRNFPSGNIFLAHTTDGGTHWTWVDTGIDGTIAVGFGYVQGGLFFADAQHGWVVGDDAVIRTVDGGLHWEKVTVTCASSQCYPEGRGVTFTGSMNGWIAGRGNLLRTTDAGAHWLATGLEFGGFMGVQDVRFPDPLNGWLTGDDGVLMNTTDGGVHWNAIDSGTSVLLESVSFPAAQRGWIVGEYGTILNYDGNRTPAGKPAIFGVVNAAGYRTGTSPNSWVSIFGRNLAESTRSWGLSDFNDSLLPTQLDGVSVTVNGRTAYPEFISPGQINFLAPADAAQGPVSVVVSTRQGASEPFLVQTTTYTPDLFRYLVEGGDYIIGQGAGGALIGDYMLAYALGLGGKMRTAMRGEIVTVYAAGLGPTSPPFSPDRLASWAAVLSGPVTVRFGRTAVTPEWAGQTTGAGLYQINLRVPQDAPDGDNVVVVEVGGYRSAVGLISVGN